MLALPRSDLPYSVDTDASDCQVGAALFQTTEDGERRPIGYWIRSLKPAEKNYSTPEKEFLAVVWELTTLCPYLQGETFTVDSHCVSKFFQIKKFICFFPLELLVWLIRYCVLQ